MHRRTRTLLLPAALVAAVATAAPPAAADGPVPDLAATQVGPSADDWLRVGLERYERGNLIGAIDAFERGHQREPRPLFLFALAQAHRKRGDCERARALFDAFLATQPAARQAEAAHQQREACEATPPPVPEPAAAPALEPAPPAGPPPPSPPPGRRWSRDPVVLGAGAASVTLLATSTALWLSADQARAAAASAETYDQHRALRDRAASRELSAGVTLGVGVAAGVVLVWRLTRAREVPPRAVAWQPVVGPTGAGVALGGRF